MKKVLIFVAFPFLIFSCKKERDEILWNRSFGPGNAYFISATADSGIFAGGELNGNPYLIKLSSDKNIIMEYASGLEGLYTSGWSDTSCYIAAGSTNGKLLITRINMRDNKIRDTTLTAGFIIERASLLYSGSGKFLAVAGADPDASGDGAGGLLIIRFDTAGQILLKKEIPDVAFISAGDVAADNSGNIYLALTRKNSGAKSRAAVAKYNSGIQKLWETELYNNPDVTSACHGIIIGGSDSIYVSGMTEVERKDGILDNSFIASLGKTGITGKKKYLENSNSGTKLVINSDNHILMLNENCYFISVIEPLNGYATELVRFFNACDAYNTDAIGKDLDINYDGNIIVAGSLSDNFYLGLKSGQQ